MADTNGLKQHYSQIETGALLLRWTDGPLLEWAEVILREELLRRGISESELAEFRAQKYNKKLEAALSKGKKYSPAEKGIDQPTSQKLIIQKTIAVLMAIVIFCTIMGMPFFMWQFGVNHSSSSGNGSGMDFLLGMTAIIWIPLLGLVSAAISASAARLLWPQK